MAGSTTTMNLAMTFGLTSGDQRTLTVNYPKDDLTESDVSACMGDIITAGNAFVDAPIKALKAVLTVTEKTVLVDNT